MKLIENTHIDALCAQKKELWYKDFHVLGTLISASFINRCFILESSVL